jgi:hypothetical protein
MSEVQKPPKQMTDSELIDAVRPHPSTKTILFSDAELIRELVHRFEPFAKRALEPVPLSAFKVMGDHFGLTPVNAEDRGTP